MVEPSRDLKFVEEKTMSGVFFVKVAREQFQGVGLSLLDMDSFVNRAAFTQARFG
jgi:hypothetical protein